MDTRPIGVFDSGLGGLTAVRQLRRVLPGEDIIYFGDTGRVPYGSRGREIIRQYARQDIRFLLSHDVKFIIAACGTVSSTYPPEEAARLPVPFTGVVGATARAAVDATRNGKVGIIGTAATVRSGSYAAVIKDMKPETEIVARACPMFVPLVENGYVNDGNPVTKLIIAEYLQEVKDAGVDTLILGCTHYPLLKKMIGDFMGSDVTLIDSGKVTAQAAAAALADLGLLNGRTEGGNAHRRVIFNGNGYSEAWEAEAERRGLPNRKCTPDAMIALKDEKNIELMEEFGVLTKTEMLSRYEVEMEHYSKILNIEARTMLKIANKQLIPAASAYMGELASSAAAKAAAVEGISTKAESKVLVALSKYTDEMSDAADDLKAVTDKVSDMDNEAAKAHAFHDEVIPAMDRLRAAADQAEELVDEDFWPLPCYSRMLFYTE